MKISNKTNMSFGGLMLFVFLLCLPWFVNVYKFTQCDFESNWKCEAIHGLGIAGGPLAWVTVWFDTDAKDTE